MVLDIWLVLSLLLLGAFVGFAAGLLGVGGGGIMVPALTSLFLYFGVPATEVVRLALGTSMASIIVTSTSSVRAHHSKNGVRWEIVKSMAPGMLLGSFAMTFLVAKLNSAFLAIFFSAFMAYVSLQMFFNIKPKPDRELPRAPALFFSGSFIGGISALVSIGGGSLTVPFLTWHNVKLTNAIGTSAALGLPISIAGTIGYLVSGWGQVSPNAYTYGYIYLPAVALISSVSYFTAPTGAKMAHQLPVARLKKIFGVLLIALSIKMLVSVI